MKVTQEQFCCLVKRVAALEAGGGGGGTYLAGDGLDLTTDTFSVDSSVVRLTGAQTVSSKALQLVTQMTFDSSAYTQVTASRDLTDADNGRILWSNSASNFTLNNPGGLTVPFNCTILQLNTGVITFTSAALFNIDTHTKTGGQGAVVSLMIRPSGTTLYLYGRTQA